MNLSEIIIRASEYPHLDYIGIGLFALVFILIILESSGFVKPFSLSYFSREAQQKNYNRPASEKIVDVLWWVIFLILIVFISVERIGYFKSITTGQSLLIVSGAIILLIVFKFLKSRRD